MQVVDALPRAFPDRSAHALAQVPAEEVKSLAPARDIDQSRLLRMELKPEPREHQAHPSSCFLDLRLRVTHHHEVIGISNQRAQMCAPVLPYPVKVMQVDVGQQRRDDAPLWSARHRPRPLSVLHHLYREPSP